MFGLKEDSTPQISGTDTDNKFHKARLLLILLTKEKGGQLMVQDSGRVFLS